MGGAAPYSAPQAPMMGGPLSQPTKKSSGCGKIILILLIILVLLGGAIAAAVYFGYRFAEKKLKSSEAYTVAVKALKENEEVKQQLGEIKDTGFPIGAFTQQSDGSGQAAFFMSVQGTKGSGQYDVELTRSNSVWHLQRGRVKLSNGETIDVLEKQVPNDESFDVNSNTSMPGDSGDSQNINAKGAINGGVLNGKAIKLPKPAYPPIARSVKASGTVVVQVLVDEEGNVVSARAVSGHPLLHAVSVAAARGAKFSPTLVSGKPVKVKGIITYNFIPE
ncbi:MAG: cytochrome c oxidase assembly factor Coa1 family protein [Pyrinomonadaceae bacterium]